jgi:hypothetical protein
VERPDHLNIPEGVGFLDLAGAEKLFFAYKRGQITLPILRYRLVADCGVPPHMVEEGIAAFSALPMSEVEKIEQENAEAGPPRATVIIEG